MEVLILMRRNITMTLIFFLLFLPRILFAGQTDHGKFLVLCYHAVPFRAEPDDTYSVTQKQFAVQMEYLRTHGYHPVSLNDIIMARDGKKDLPGNAVLLTFDDAYISYYTYVLPLLEELGYPSVLAVVGAFQESPPKDLPEPLMTWEQIKEASRHKLVNVVSHSYDLHKSVQYNPQGNTGSAVSVRAYNPATKTYESEEEYRSRLEADFIAQKKLFMDKLGFAPTAIVWPYGRYNSVSLDVAKKHGMELTFSLDEGAADIHHLDVIRRNVVETPPIDDFLVHEQQIGNFIAIVKKAPIKRPFIRAVQVDLDPVYDPDGEHMENKLGKLIDRLFEMKVNTVFLKAFAGPAETEGIKNLYFPSRVLPMRADLFSHAAHQMMIRGILVYAWMPALSVDLPDKKLEEMYEDLAMHSQIQGILFQDDFSGENISKTPVTAKQPARDRTGGLEVLAQGAKKFRPGILFARNINSGALEDPKAEERFEHDYERFLENYDLVVVTAYPQMDGIRRPSAWLEELVKKARAAKGIDKTIFKVQSYDWNRKDWIGDEALLEELRDILSAGGRHLAYYPDDLWKDKPALNKIKLEMSTKTNPFLP
jgi:biofilm PGA synthesis lipoprotein PgaB